MNQLIVENINFSYGKKSILRDINFKVENGLIGLLGKNGAGKTTLIKILVTLYRPSSGSIVFNGYKYNNYTNEIRKYLGYLQQDFNMYKNLTGLDYLKFVAKMRNIKNIDEEIKEICDMLNLDKYIKKRIGTYSGGIKRRLGIAQAILGDVKLIILDDPTVGLDITEDIEFLCDKLIVLKDKTVKFEGSVENFIEYNKYNICQEIVNKIKFDEIINTEKVISYKVEENKVCVKYIAKNNKKPAENITLQDAYINFLEE